MLEIEFSVPVNGTASLLSTAVSGETYTSDPSGSSEWLITHSRHLKEVITQYDSMEYNKMMPKDVELIDDSSLIATWTTFNSGMGIISSSEIIWYETTAKSTWYIDHRLGCESVICLFFNNDDKMIQPESMKLINNNRIMATFSEDFSGYALVRSINRSLLESDVMESIKYWKVGGGTSGFLYDPVTSNDVESMFASGSVSEDDYYYDNNYYYLDLELGKSENDLDIREIAWFDENDIIRFYTYCSNIHKPKDVWFNTHLRVKRSQT
jgi:hypothetical protein